jgi:hypothetical protein
VKSFGVMDQGRELFRIADKGKYRHGNMKFYVNFVASHVCRNGCHLAGNTLRHLTAHPLPPYLPLAPSKMSEHSNIDMQDDRLYVSSTLR